ncbi:helix-turn-helix domain-containing protein [Emticicia sp. CRIBPO]|uniref:DUF6597 domain-containing transcriptional factor n=1 Tax=Emticicia sp. CRIBPO TaxID=2683258 RepID=UPI001412C3FB|nr:DUF6597 domain-containing transcriptional factor [Emticicia sp. CRIBPO]NBA85731.1 helix-turn-helix domain-containing protein [Emticicia sp. CRIBPO]
MIYRKITPSPLLTSYVECFYIWESDVMLSSDILIESPPTGYTSMVFNYGTAHRIINNKYKSQFTPAAFISGQSTRRYQLQIGGKLGMIGVVFKPSALNTLFGIPMFEITDERVEISQVLGREGSELYERILESGTIQMKVDCVEQFLLRKVSQNKSPFDKNDFVSNLIFEKKGVISLKELQDDLFICRRQFQRQFLRKVGVSPKYFARISRISNLCALMARKNWKIEDWHDLVLQYGYYDQSHFIREFTEFMDEVPSVYVKSNTELANYLR